MKIRIRNDDVLFKSKGWTDPAERFRQVDGWMAVSDNVIHVPAILVNEIQDFPDTIKMIRDETAKGRMMPEIHGLMHIDYAKVGLPREKIDNPRKVDFTIFSPEEIQAHLDEVRSHLRYCKDWITHNFGRAPRIWYTPWGASEPTLHQAAREEGLLFVGTDRTVTIKEGCRKLREGHMTVEQLDGCEFFTHWWDRGLAIWRMSLATAAGSWEEGARRSPDVFNG